MPPLLKRKNKNCNSGQLLNVSVMRRLDIGFDLQYAVYHPESRCQMAKTFGFKLKSSSQKVKTFRFTDLKTSVVGSLRPRPVKHQDEVNSHNEALGEFCIRLDRIQRICCLGGTRKCDTGIRNCKELQTFQRLLRRIQRLASERNCRAFDSGIANLWHSELREP